MSNTDMKPLVTIVTGSNRGVGLAIVQAIAAGSTPTTLYAASRGDRESVKALVERIEKEEGRVDRLINNAGVNVDHEEGMSTAEKAKQTLDINYRGTLSVIRSFLPLMTPDTGRIVSLSSVASHLDPFPKTIATRFRTCKSMDDVTGLATDYEASAQNGKTKQDGWPGPYQVSKALTNAMTAVLAKENPTLLINCCCPGGTGWCNSDMGNILGKPPKTNEEGARIPLRLAFNDIGNVSGRFWEEASISSKGEGGVSEW